MQKSSTGKFHDVPSSDDFEKAARYCACSSTKIGNARRPMAPTLP
jgi:hypothetical protein